MAVWNICTMLKFRAFSSFCRTLVLHQKNEEKISSVLLKLSKPKRPANGFVRFLQKNSTEIRKKNPGLSVTEISRVASKMWADLPEKEKSSYNLEYSMELEEYKSLMESYSEKVKALGDDKLLRGGNKFNEADKKLLGKPNRPLVPFFLFRASLKKASPDTVLTLSQVKEKWDACDETLKKKFEEEHKKALEKYQKDLLEWEKEMYKKGYSQLLRLNTRAQFSKGSVD